MRSPVLVTPASALPVTLDEAKLHLRVEDDEDDALIEGLIRGAVSHLDGWTGVLGRCICEQTWRLDSDAFERRIRLPLGPIVGVVNVTWRNVEGQLSTVSDDEYLVQGQELVFRTGFNFPGDIIGQDAVAITWIAGYAEEDIPPALKVAILLMVGQWYENRETVAAGSFSELPFAATTLIGTFRRGGL